MITIRNSGRATVLTIGIPFARGSFRKGTLSATVNGRHTAIWHEVRSRWSDQSARWVWVHVPVHEGESRLEFTVQEKQAECAKTALKEKDDGWCLQVEEKQLFIDNKGLFSFECNGHFWNCSGEATLFAAESGHGKPELTVTLVEESQLAPLVRLSIESKNILRTDYLLRMIPASSQLIVWRRITVLAAEIQELRSMELDFSFDKESEWNIPGLVKGRSLDLQILKHGRVTVEGREQEGFPEIFIQNESGALYIEKAWQRFPIGLEANPRTLALQLYPEKAAPLKLWPGTSIRHRFHIFSGAESTMPQLRWQIDPEYFVETNVLGPMIARSEKTWHLFPAYELGYDQAFRNIRKTKLDDKANATMGDPAPLEKECLHAPEYFGLVHYGDWPLEWGRYAGETPHHRAYADNEYDAPFGFLQQFARTGEWPLYEISREGVIHMADVDMDILTPAMYYHGYRINCDDHDTHRPDPGIGDHSWTDSLWIHYFLSGDLWAKETAEAIGNVFLNTFKNPDFDTLLKEWWHCERAIGWPLIQMSTNVEARGNKGELAICHNMATFLKEAMTEPYAFTEKNSTIRGKPFKWFRTGGIDGSKTFMLGICLEGLERYYTLSNDQEALDAMIKIADFLISSMWHPETGMFTYEHNAYFRKHRHMEPFSGLMVVRSLAWLYDKTGEEKYRDVARTAFFSSLWIFINQINTHNMLDLNENAITSARELAQLTRSSNAAVYWLYKWNRERTAAVARQAQGEEFQFSGAIRELYQSPAYCHESGTPQFEDNGALYVTPRFSKDAVLTDEGQSFMEGGFKHPVANDSGEIEISIVPHWSGDNQRMVFQRSFLYLSDTAMNQSSLQIIAFCGNLHLRLHDERQQLITSLESPIDHWQENETYTVKVRWNTAEITLLIDNNAVDKALLSRAMGGVFRRIFIGYHPLHWSAEGILKHIKIACAKQEKKVILPAPSSLS